MAKTGKLFENFAAFHNDLDLKQIALYTKSSLSTILVTVNLSTKDEMFPMMKGLGMV